MTVTVIYTNPYMTAYQGLSTDSKPTNCDGCTFLEVDTKKLYAYQNGTWYEISE